MSVMFKHIKRVIFDVIIAVVLFFIYATGFYKKFDSPIQLILLKVLLVSMGFLHAHILRMLAFHSVDWDGKYTPRKILIICLYVTIIYCYAVGG